MPCLVTDWPWIWTMHFIRGGRHGQRFRDAEDYEGFKVAVILNFGVDTAITEEEFLKESAELARREIIWRRNTELRKENGRSTERCRSRFQKYFAEPG